MHRLFLIPILIVLTSLNAHAQEDTIEVKIKLVTNLDTVDLLPYCGFMMWRSTFEFEVLEVLKGTYADETIKVSITCPREAIEFKSIVNGGVYQYQLTKRKGIEQLKIGQRDEVEYLNDYEIVSVQ